VGVQEEEANEELVPIQKLKWPSYIMAFLSKPH